MTILFAFLSAIMFLDCVVLVLLILVQVPKKEAGAGMAFGGSAADALFGAGSGTALTTITKYSAGIFFGAAMLMAIMAAHLTPATSGAFEEALTKSGAAGQPATPLTPVASSNLMQMPLPGAPAPANSSVPAASNTPASAVVPPAAPPAAPPKTPLEAPTPSTNK